MTKQLTRMQAFRSMEFFLDHYFKVSDSNDIALFLSDMSLCDGKQVTFDAAVWIEWKEFTNEKDPMTPLEAYKGMLKHLTYYQSNTHSDDIKKLLAEISLTDQDKFPSTSIRKHWKESVQKAIDEGIPIPVFVSIKPASK